MGHQQQFDIEEWEAMLGKLLRFHDNISLEIGVIIQTIRKEMKQDLVPVAEEKATFGKVSAVFVVPTFARPSHEVEAASLQSLLVLSQKFQLREE